MRAGLLIFQKRKELSCDPIFLHQVSTSEVLRKLSPILEVLVSALMP